MRKLILAALLLPGTALANNDDQRAGLFQSAKHRFGERQRHRRRGRCRRKRLAGASAGSSSANQTSRIVRRRPAVAWQSGPCTGRAAAYRWRGRFAAARAIPAWTRGCDARETARILMQVGLPDHARGDAARVSAGDGRRQRAPPDADP